MRGRGGAVRPVHLALAALILGLAVRLPWFASPPMSWRQADNASMARNYWRHGMDFLRPQIDWSGTGTGVVQSEFPVFQYSVAALYRAAGFHDWMGRLVPVASALGCIWVVFLLAGRLYGERAGAWAALLLAGLPLFTALSRAVRIESPMLLACAFALLSLHRWLERRSSAWFWAFVGAAALAGLLKVIALVHLFFPVAALCWWRHRNGMWLRWRLWAAALLILAPVLGWYAWSGHLLALGGNTLFGDWSYGADKWGNWASVASWKFWNRIIFQSFAEKHITWAGVPLFAAGFLWGRGRDKTRLFEWWLAGLLVYSAVVTNGSFVHEHYQLPFVVPAAALMGRAVAGWKWNGAVRNALLAAFFITAVSRGFWEVRKEAPGRNPVYRLAGIMREMGVSGKGNLVLTIDSNNPLLLYLADCRGWVADVRGLETAAVVSRAGPARYAAGYWGDPGQRGRIERLLAPYVPLHRDAEVFLYRLEEGR